MTDTRQNSLIAVIKVKSLTQLSDKLAGTDLGNFDLIELRLDYCSDLNKLEELKNIHFPLPLILTLRAKSQGGAFQGSEEERIAFLKRLMSLKPEYIDLEEIIPDKDLKAISLLSPETKIILSYHNFIETPEISTLDMGLVDFFKVHTEKNKLERDGQEGDSSLGNKGANLANEERVVGDEGPALNNEGVSLAETEPNLLSPGVAEPSLDGERSILRETGPSLRSLADIFDSMTAKPVKGIYKIACQARTSLDALKLMLFCKKQRERKHQIISISMGELGETSRIMGPLVGEAFAYCPLDRDDATAPGQLRAEELLEIYNYKSLDEGTEIYGLIGSPVDKSVGHTFHNSLNKEEGKKALYVKWNIADNELKSTLRLLAYLGVKGLSVTMPLKELALKECLPDEDTQRIGATNTLKACLDREENFYWAGTNTDGAGALATLRKKIKALEGKDLSSLKVLILGAGGASKALISSLHQTKAEIKIYNRSLNKSLPYGIAILPLSEIFGVSSLPEHDIIINTLPFSLNLAFERIPFQEGTLAFDISYAQDSAFLKRAKMAGCAILDGKGMFEEQALLQREFWGLTAK